jgi:hypothetical protein
MNDRPPAAVRTPLGRADEAHAQRVAELEKTIAGLRELLRELAGSALQLLKTSPPREPADAVIVGDIVKRARKALAHLDRPGG